MTQVSIRTMVFGLASIVALTGNRTAGRLILLACAAVLCNGVLLSTHKANAQGIYEFVSVNDSEPPVSLAIMNLGGISPFDHTDIISLAWTDAGSDLLSNTLIEFSVPAGLYPGTFTSTSLGAPFDAGPTDRHLMGGAGGITRSVSIDAPDRDGGMNGSVALGFGAAGDNDEISYNGTLFLRAQFFGQWTRIAVPEPTSFVMLMAGLIGIAIRRRHVAP